MRNSIHVMAAAVDAACGHGLHSLWLHGSVVLNDFRPGWSDIDLIALTKEPIAEAQADSLLMLRQKLAERFPENPYYRCFEGIICCLEEFRAGQFRRLVYWGTSGQRITDRYCPDPFARYELAHHGECVFGDADRSLFTAPDQGELEAAVRKHYEAIRMCAVSTDDSLYSCGWLLDLARCVYTLRYHKVIGKTQAGIWALENHVFPDEEALRKTLMIRKDPISYRGRPEIRTWLKSLGPTVQRCADVLERELEEKV